MDRSTSRGASGRIGLRRVITIDHQGLALAVTTRFEVMGDGRRVIQVTRDEAHRTGFKILPRLSHLVCLTYGGQSDRRLQGTRASPPMTG
jgi:hypothetical protein